MARCCFMISSEGIKFEDPLTIDKLDQRDNEERGEPAEQLILIPLQEVDPTKNVLIGSQLFDQERSQIIDLLRANVDIFVWSAIDMPGIPPKIITH